MVNEVLPKDQLLDRAWELARELVKRPPLTLRYTRQLFTNPLKRAFLDELGHGLARETYAQRAFFPFGGEMAAARPAVGPAALVQRTDNPSTKEHSDDRYSAEARHRTRQVHPRLPGPRHRPGQLRGLHLRGVLRRRAQGRLRAKLAVRRAHGTPAAQGFLLHPRAAWAAGVDRHHPRPRRQRVRLPQRLRTPRQQGRLAGTPAGGVGG